MIRRCGVEDTTVDVLSFVNYFLVLDLFIHVVALFSIESLAFQKFVCMT